MMAASHVRAPRHADERRPVPGYVFVLAVVLALAASVLAGVVSGSYAHNASAAAPARATLASSTETLGQRILDKEETRTGDWYVYGGTGPYVFDCSGLVYWAATSLGLKNWPRTTYELLASPRLERIPLASATRGDLMFYGSGHVEMNTVWYHQTFGAQTWGTRVGWHAWNSYWEPTMAYRILW